MPSSKNYLIIGVDPGTTSALAALDLKGNIQKVISRKELGLAGIIRIILQWGYPAMLATDKSQPPRLLTQLSAKLGCPIYAPSEDLSRELKLYLTKDMEVKDDHQRDALVAALYAYRHYHNKLRNLYKRGVSEEVIAQILAGHHISKAPLEKPNQRKKTTQPPLPQQKRLTPPRPSPKRLLELERENIALHKKVEELEKEVKEREEKLLREKRKYLLGIKEREEIRKLENKLEHMREERKKLMQLRVEFEKVKKLWEKLAEGEIRAVGVFPNSLSGLSLLTHPLPKNVNVDTSSFEIIFTDHKQSCRMLVEKGVKIAPSTLVKEQSGLYYVEVSSLEKYLKEEGKVDLNQLIEEYRKGRGII